MRISEGKLRRLIRSIIKESSTMDHQSINDKVMSILEHYISQLDQAYENDSLDDAFDAFYGHKTSDYIIGFNYMMTNIAAIFESIIGISSNRFFASSSPLGRELVDIKINIYNHMDQNGPIHMNISSIKHLVEEVIQKIEDGSLSLFEDEDVV